MQFQVKRVGELIAEFKDQKDAEAFIEKIRLPQDAQMNLKSIYYLSELGEVIKEFDPKKMTVDSNAATTTSQGTKSGQSFKPSPFDTTPRPGGPKNWLVDEEDEKKDK